MIPGVAAPIPPLSLDLGAGPSQAAGWLTSPITVGGLTTGGGAGTMLPLIAIAALVYFMNR